MTEIYLDNAATSFPKPECVYRAVEEFMRGGGGSPGRGSYPKAQESERILVRLRSALGRLLGVRNPSRIVLTCNSTDALNLALKGLFLYRLRGDKVFFLCGADEHGARTEYVAQGYGMTPQQLLDSKFSATVPLLEKLGLSFDAFERTGDPFHRDFVRDLFVRLGEQGAVTRGTQRVAWCTRCRRHLPDRFLEGTCPHCSGRTYGNQCNNKKECARQVEPEEIGNARCAVCAGSLEWRQEPHLLFDLERFRSAVLKCARAPMRDAAEVRARIEQTLAEDPRVCVTRDTAWGIPVPGLAGKTVYSWVDSLLAKVSMVLKRGADAERPTGETRRRVATSFSEWMVCRSMERFYPRCCLQAGAEQNISSDR